MATKDGCVIAQAPGYDLKKELKNKEIPKPKGNRTLSPQHVKTEERNLRIEVALRFNSVEDLKGSKVKHLVLRRSLKELKGFNDAVAKGVYTDSTRETIDFIAFHTVNHTTPHKAKSVKLKTSKPQERLKTDTRDKKGPDKFKSKGSIMKKKFDTNQNGKGIQCREYEGYGYIQAQCANTLKKKRSMNTILSDDNKKSDTKNDEEDADSNETLAFNVVID
ncbi:hypothetical protein M9H77_17568 [Catharanthus roseus]|uniref:Uncharacterized protein n=1 Tax=Catharanthus roseus TaxID=4058 RepID=A0ACC0B4X8_CATRO|nr:hypothetical protein M9H77_17568 [Catharanthus roseus]